MKLSVIGTGYVGLVTGTCFAETGNQVTCIDIDVEKVRSLTNKQITIYEPGLETLFKRNIEQGRLSFTTDLVDGIKGSKVIFFALPTPPNEDGSADLKYILQVAENIAPFIKENTIVVNKSTVPVGTASKVSAMIAKKTSVSYEVISNPEFLKEGVAIMDFMKPDRVVIGAKSEYAKEIMKQLYKPFVRQGNPILFMNVRSAELTKYAANSFLATKISFINEIANLCDLLEADVDDVRKGIGTDSRIGKSFLYSGIGYGGSCFPKDVDALIKSSDKVGHNFELIKVVNKINDNQKIKLITPLLEYFNHKIKGKTIAIWGLSFKSQTDDIREAPSIENINILLEKEAKIRVFDPVAMKNLKKNYKDQLYYANDEYDVLKNADALMIMTEWSIFRNPQFDIMAKNLKNKVIFDGRNLYDINEMEKLDFTYHSIGRKTIKKG